MADKRTVKETGQGRKSTETEALTHERLTECYRSLVESISDSLYIVDARCRYLFANRHHLEKRGMTLEEILGSPYRCSNRRGHDKEFADRVKEVLTAGTTIQFEHPAQTDPQRYILQTFSPITDRNGNVAAVAVVSKDITRRKRMEEALRESEDRYRDLVEGANEPICTHDPDGNLISVNEALIKLLGYGRNELVGKNICDFLAPEVRDTCGAYRTALKTKGKAGGTVIILNRSGDRRTLEYNNTLRKEGVTAPIVRVMMHDVTERTNAEQALNNTLSLLRTTLDSTADGILVVDRERKVQTCNRRFTEMWRIPKSLAQLQDDSRLLAHMQDQLEDPEDFIARVQELYARPKAQCMDELHFRDGRIFERYSQPQRENRKITGRVWSFRDVTRRRQAEYLYTTLVNSSPIGIYLALDGKIQYANPQFRKNSGFSMVELERRKTLHLVHPDDRETVRRNAILMLKGMASIPYKFRSIRKNGEIGWILETVASITYKGKMATLGSHIDITEQTRTEAALQQSEERYRAIIEDIEDGYYEADLAGNFTFCNEAALKILGYSREEIIGSNCSRYMDSKNAKKLFRTFNAVYKTGIPSRGSEWEVAGKDGKRRDIEVSVSLIRDADGRERGFRGIFRDTTERRKAEETIRHLAYHDALTGLPNRLLFHDRLTVALANAKRSRRQLALLMLDLDEFKEVNDNLGHHTGDILLREVGERLTGLLRGSDTIARLGGDEFMLLVPEIPNAEDYMVIAGKIIKALHKPFLCDGQNIRITTSIGIAIYPHHGSDPVALMKHADIAMYRAKKKGRDNYQIFT
jgi:diguanylate cyclase (GGDEF)-like protein/PAS domain S-box-containing protein